MAITTATQAQACEDGGAFVMARVVGNDAANITQASVTSIARKTFDLDSATPNTATTTAPVVADTIFDTLQTDARWTEDDTGWNFGDVIAASVLSTGDHHYRIEYVLTMDSGEPVVIKFEIHATSILGS